MVCTCRAAILAAHAFKSLEKAVPSKLFSAESVSLPVNALLLLADMALIQDVGDCPSTEGQEETSDSRKQQCGLTST